MEFYYGLLIGVVVFKIFVITLYCCLRTHRPTRSTRRVVVVREGAMPASRGTASRRPGQNDHIAIVGHAEPMGTSPPPRAPAPNPPPPPYEQATYAQKPSGQNRQNPSAPAPFPEGSNGVAPYACDPNARRPYLPDPNAQGPYHQAPNAQGQYAHVPYPQHSSA